MSDEREWQKQLEAGLKRVQDALARDERPHAQLLQAVVAAASAKALEKLDESASRVEERRRQREERREERREARRLKKEREAESAAPVGVVFAAFAALTLYFGVARPDLWWMLFVSFGFAISAAGILGSARAAKRRRLEAAAASAPQALAAPQASSATSTAGSAIDQRVERVEAVCQKVLGAIEGGPPAVREIVHKPEATLQALSRTCAELARRERELRAAVTEDDERRLRAERDGLASRIAAEADPVSKERLSSALRALEAQLAQRAELATAASRLEAEQTRILYTLENLHTQVLRARSADAASADVAGAGLRRGLEQLGEEIAAVASALEETHAAGLVSPVVDVAGGRPGPGPGRDRERG